MAENRRATTAGTITRAGVVGLTLVLIGGAWAYVESDGDPSVDKLIVTVALILVAVLIGAAIAIEAVRIHRQDGEPDQ